MAKVCVRSVARRRLKVPLLSVQKITASPMPKVRVVADPSVGQRIKAIVVLQGDARGKVSEDEIKAYCKRQLAEYKVPHIVEFRGELPKTDVGKVSRRELRDEASA